jgi:hypothetical protein
MSTIFPGSASVNQIFDGYQFNGTAWDIVGIDLTADYLENSTASATYLTQINASTIYATKLEAQSAAKGFNLLNATTDVALGTTPGNFGSDVLVYVDVNDYAYSVGDNVKLKNIYDVGELNPVFSASATSASELNSESLEYQLVTFNTSSPMDIYPNQYITASAANGSGWVIQLFVYTVSETVITGYPQTLTAPASPTVTSSWIFERDTINSPLPTYYNASRNIIGNISSVGSNSYTVDIIQQPTAMWESNTCDVSLTGLNGEVGATGATGAPGAEGAMGPAGEPGINGVNGASGLNGLDGLNGIDGIGYSVQASSLTHNYSYESVQIGISTWQFSGANSYTVGDKIRLSRTVTINLGGTPTPEIEEIKGIITSITGTNFDLDVYYAQSITITNNVYPSDDGPYNTDTNTFNVSITADDGATGNPGIGYAKDATIVSFGMPMPLYVGQTATIKFLDPITYDPIQHSYQVGNRIKLAQKSNTSNYAEGFVTQLGDPSGGPLAIKVVIDYTSNTVQTMFGLDASIISGGPPRTKDISASPNNITITAEDMGKYIYTSSAANVTITVNPFSLNSLPAGSQVTVIQRAPGTVTITGGGMDSIYFSETDGYTDGLSIQLKGMYSAATIIKSDGYNEWIVIGDLANPVPNNGGGGGG